MKTSLHTLSIFCLALALGTVPAFAQNDAAKEKKLTGKLVKGTEVVGANIFNQKGDDLGEIRDVLFDENGGGVSHAILDLGTYLGVGAKLTAVPWKHIKQSEKDTQGYVVELDKTKLSGAPQFDKSAWPDFNDNWYQKSYSYYGLTGKTGIKLVRASKVHGAKLFDQMGTHIGELENTLLHPNSGKVAYGVVSLDTPAIGDKQTAVPWKLIRQSKEATPGFVVNVDKAKLTNAVYFGENEWPNYSDNAWNERTYGYYGVDPYWATPVVY